MTTRRSSLASAPAIPLALSEPVIASTANHAAHAVDLQQTLDEARAYAEATPEGPGYDAEIWRRIQVADAVEDRLRALPCDCPEVAISHARIIARDVSTGERFSAEVHFHHLADGLLRFFGEPF